MDSPASPRLLTVEKALVLAAALIVPAYIILDWSFLHPGFADFEENVLEYIQAALDGARPGWALGQDGLWLHFLALVSRLAGPSLAGIHFLVLAALGLESLLLFDLTRTWLGLRSARWAVLVNLVAGFTFLRGRTLLPFGIEAFDLLALAYLCSRSSAAPWAAAAGLWAGLGFLEDRAWILSLAVGAVICLVPARQAGKKTRWAWLAAGLALGVGLAMLLSRQNLLAYGWQGLRQGLSSWRGAPGVFWHNQRQFWLGSASVLPYLSVAQHPVFPTWAWPGLAAGLWLSRKHSKWIWAWLAIGWLGLWVPTPAFEASKATVAWPAFCMLAGLGFQWLAALWEKQAHWLARLGLGLALGLGLTWELHAYRASLEANYANYYETSLIKLKAARWLRQQCASAPHRVLMNLDFYPPAAFRFLLGRLPAAKPDAPSIALVPWDYLPAMGPQEMDRWVVFLNSAEEPEIFFFNPTPDWEARLAGIDKALAGLWKQSLPMPLAQRRDLFLGFLGKPETRDPWLRTACWEAVVRWSFQLNDYRPVWVEEALSEPLLSAGPVWYAAGQLSNTEPQLAFDLYQKAMQIDPRRQVDLDKMQELRSLSARKGKSI